MLLFFFVDVEVLFFCMFGFVSCVWDEGLLFECGLDRCVCDSGCFFLGVEGFVWVFEMVKILFKLGLDFVCNFFLDIL